MLPIGYCINFIPFEHIQHPPKNDKLARFILVKIVIPIEMCQTIDFIFFLASLKSINTVQKFAWQYVTYFYPYEFPKKTPFIKR